MTTDPDHVIPPPETVERATQALVALAGFAKSGTQSQKVFEVQASVAAAAALERPGNEPSQQPVSDDPCGDDFIASFGGVPQETQETASSGTDTQEEGQERATPNPGVTVQAGKSSFAAEMARMFEELKNED